MTSLLPLVVFLSGAASLVYEIVWMRMLIRAFGITLYATSTILAVFMGGLALGSWMFGRWSRARSCSLKTYAGIELGIGLSALTATFFIQNLPTLYAQLHARWHIVQVESSANIVLRLLLSGVVLAVPTALMGSTLPLLTKIVTQPTDRAESNLARLYGLNTLGAVAGVLLSGFYLIGCWGEMAAVGLAVAGNLTLAAVLFSGRFPRFTAKDVRADFIETSARLSTSAIFLTTAAVSGFCALSFEVLWSRMLILLLGTSVYAFSLTLAFYLLGVALGSFLFEKTHHRLLSPAVALGLSLMSIAILGIISLHVIRLAGLSALHPRYLYSPLTSISDVVRMAGVAAAVVFPIAFGFGFTFPLFGRLLLGSSTDIGGSVGALYAANTVGSVAGSLLSAFFFIPVLGMQVSFVVLCFLLFLSGLGVIFLMKQSARKPAERLKHILLAGAAGLLLVGLIPSKKDIFLEILAGRLSAYLPGRFLFHTEQSAATVTGYEGDNKKILLINGVLVSGNGVAGTIMVQLPLLIHPQPEQALVVCFGVGNTMRAARNYIGRVDVVELVRGALENNKYFFDDTDRVFADPGVGLTVNDGRNFMLTTPNSYDVIIVDASPPIFSEGTVNLYSEEFIRLGRKRLKPGGIFCLWVPTPCFESDFWMIARNFSETFEHLSAWAHPQMAGVLLMGSSEELTLPMDQILRRARERGVERESPWIEAHILQNGWFLSEQEIRARAGRYPPVTDNRPYTEFPLMRFLKKERFWNSPKFLLNADDR